MKKWFLPLCVLVFGLGWLGASVGQSRDSVIYAMDDSGAHYVALKVGPNGLAFFSPSDPFQPVAEITAEGALIVDKIVAARGILDLHGDLKMAPGHGVELSTGGIDAGGGVIELNDEVRIQIGGLEADTISVTELFVEGRRIE